MTKNANFDLRGPVSTDPAACAVDWNCIDLTARTIVRGSPTYTYCGVGRKRTLVAVNEPTPAPSTATIQGLEAEIMDVISEFSDSQCPLWMQRVGCDGDVEHYTGLRLGDSTAQNPLTANGPDATASALIEQVSLLFDKMYRLRPPSKADLVQYVSSNGYYTASPVTGLVDGSNTIYTLPTAPLDGFPIVVYIDGVVEAPAGYTINGGTIIFDVAPACGEVVTADYYDSEFLLYGLVPLRVLYCGDGCGSASCSICNTVYAIYDTTVPSDPDACGTSEGTAPVVVTFSHIQGVMNIRTISLFTNIANVLDATCTRGGDLVIAAESGLYEGCTDVAVAMDSLPGTVRRLAYDYEADTIYGLFGNSGVLRRGSNGVWAIAANDNGITAEYQNDIAASSGVIVTGGTANSIQVSTNAGGLFVSKAGPGSAIEEIVSVSVGSAGGLDEQTQLISVMTIDNITRTYLYVSGSLGDTWSEARKTWAELPTNTPDVILFENWLMYVMFDDAVWRNANKGCVQCGSWEEMPNKGLLTHVIGVCYHDPNRIVSVARPDEAAVPDYGAMSGASLTVETFAVLANDYTEVELSAINPATLAIVSNSEDADTTAAVVANEIQLTVDSPVTAGTIAYIIYTVDTTGGSTLTGTLAVSFT